MVGSGPADGGSNPSPRVSVAIQHHPSRAHLLEPLLASLPGAEVVADPDPDGKRSAWRTYRVALERTPADADYRVILQDDVRPCLNFLLALDRILQVQPESLIVLFHGVHPQPNLYRLRTVMEAGGGLALLDPNQWVPVVGVCWPAAAALALPGWFEEQKWPRGYDGDEWIVGQYALEKGMRVYASCPSLVQHLDEPSVGPPIKRVLTGRQATYFIGDDDPLAIDWAWEPPPRVALRRGDTWGR